MFRPRSPLLSPLGIFLVALSLSIGWGIRGNYGHETGAMFPGAIAAVAACLLAGRADWRERVAYFAFFGALGWGFGGSISYMQVISYTHSGQYATQIYGFAGLYLIGFLWGALGGGGTALPAVLDRQRLTDMFVPLVVVMLTLATADFVIPIISDKLQTEGAMKRQDSPLYWLDTDWLQAFVVLVAVLLFDLVERRGARIWELGLLAAIGAAVGAGAQWALRAAGFSDRLWNTLVVPQGDTERFAPETLLNNWPNFLPDAAPHIGWAVGLAVGVAVYFALRGRFAKGSSLFLYMSLGWLISFLLLPVLGSVFLAGHGGLRMTPPRGDNWAGILGVVLGAFYWCWRERLAAVAIAMLISGAIGGLGFSGIALLKLVMVSPGNPGIVTDPEVVAHWQHWQQANWHSFLEQSYGFINGIGIAIALGVLAPRLAPVDNAAPRRRWTEIVALVVAVPWLLYVNMVKNIADWTRDHSGYRSLPEVLQSPLFDSVELTALDWFNVFFGIAAAAFVLLLVAHTWRPLAILPKSWLGRGQWLWFMITWAFVIGNFTKALTGFTDSRLLTEGVIIINAVLATLLILLLPRETAIESAQQPADLRWLLWGSVVFALLAGGAAPPLETAAVRRIYGDHRAGHSNGHFRFGDDADWKMRPIERGARHR